MDIFIVRDGEETGPFGEETTQTLLDQGTVAADDLAWRPGMTDWAPLREVLALPPESPTPADLAKGSSDPLPAVNAPPELAKSGPESATAKQKAFLGYLNISFPESLTKEGASVLMNDAMEDPSFGERIGKWTEDRLKLHPDLFAAEIHARKENRANHFFDVCHTEGAEFFGRITKAHCQVLVGFLDVKFPMWDARMEDAANNYFFPAIAEKFPQLIDRQWRDRFHYIDGARSSSEQNHRTPTARIKKRPITPLMAAGRGLAAGLLLLGALYVGQRTYSYWVARHSTEKTDAAASTPSPTRESADADAPKPAVAAVEESQPDTSSAPEASTRKKGKKKKAAQGAAETPTSTPAAAVAAATPAPIPAENPVAVAPAPDKAPSDPSMSPAPPVAATTPPTVPTPATPAAGSPTAPVPAPAPGSAPVAGAPVAPVPAPAPVAGSPVLPGPAPAPAPTAPAPGPAPVAGSPVAPAAPAPDGMAVPGAPPATAPATPATPPTTPDTATVAKSNLLLTKPVDLQLAYGKVKLPVGTMVKFVSRNGAAVKVNYQNNVIVLPASSTDIDSAPPDPGAPSPAAPPAPAPSTPS